MIKLTIPENFTHEFLGIMALDVLHDAKGRGYLAGHKLCKITDLLTMSFTEHNDGLTENEINILKQWVFKKVLRYLVELWDTNISALGITERPDFTNNTNAYWSFMRDTVMLPIRTVADREDEDTFASLGGTKYGVEAQNYHDQKQKLEPQHGEILSFISPHGVTTPSDYYRQAVGIVDIIKQRTSGHSKSVMDMKSSAGLIRTITDPLGYVTGLPTYADPGYNMPGMSAIRKHSEQPFLQHDLAANQYRGPSEFQYTVCINTPVKTGLTLMQVNYFYGVAESGMDRKNMIVRILNENFKGTLPRSTMMAESLNKYLTPQEQPLTMTTGETLQALQQLIINYYTLTTDLTPSLTAIDEIYGKIHKGERLSLDNIIDNPAKVVEWVYAETDSVNHRIGYILGALRIVKMWRPGFFDDHPAEGILPVQMITIVLPELMYEFLETSNTADLAFAYHILKLLEEYTSNGIEPEIIDHLSKQWLPKRKGKLTTQIHKNVAEWRKSQSAILLKHRTKLHQYTQKLLQTCHTNLPKLHAHSITETGDLQIDSLLQFLHYLPFFDIPAEIKEVLDSHLFFYHRKIHLRSENIVKSGLYVAALLDAVIWPKPLLNFNLCTTTPWTVQIPPESDYYEKESVKLEALQTVLGKFSGDFGQIMWSIANGHIFSSEDNNTSAMALMLHRLPRECIEIPNKSHCVWGNIHGLGDGGCVDIIIDKQSRKRKGPSVLLNLVPSAQL